MSLIIAGDSHNGPITFTIDDGAALRRQLAAYWLPATAAKLSLPPQGDGPRDR